MFDFDGANIGLVFLIFKGDDIAVGPNPAGLMRITRIIINTIREIRFS